MGSLSLHEMCISFLAGLQRFMLSKKHILYSVHVRESAICILHRAICILHWCARVFTIYCTVGSFDDHAHHGTNSNILLVYIQ